jgi:hypothetical protein
MRDMQETDEESFDFKTSSPSAADMISVGGGYGLFQEPYKVMTDFSQLNRTTFKRTDITESQTPCATLFSLS